MAASRLYSAIELQSRIRELIKLAKEQGYLTFDDLNEALPEGITDADELDLILTRLRRLEIDIIEASEVDRYKDGKKDTEEDLEEEERPETKVDILDDPVRMYLKQMGQVPLLTREQEVEISKRIEEAEDMVLKHINRFGFIAQAHLDLAGKLIEGRERFDAIKATAHCASMLVPGRASVIRRVTAPLSHSTPLTRPARASSPGVSSRSWPDDDISARRYVTRPPFSHARTRSSVLFRRTPEGRPAADGGALHLGAAARAQGAAPARGDHVAGVGPAAADRRARGGAHLAPQAVELLGAQPAGRAARIQAGAPEDLVGQQVAHARDDALVHRRAFRGAVPRPTRAAEVVAGDLGGVGADGGEVGLQPGAAQTALVAQGDLAAVLEVHDEAVPSARCRLLVERDAPGHAEVQPEHRPVPRGLPRRCTSASIRTRPGHSAR